MLHVRQISRALFDLLKRAPITVLYLRSLWSLVDHDFQAWHTNDTSTLVGRWPDWLWAICESLLTYPATANYLLTWIIAAIITIWPAVVPRKCRIPKFDMQHRRNLQIVDYYSLLLLSPRDSTVVLHPYVEWLHAPPKAKHKNQTSEIIEIKTDVLHGNKVRSQSSWVALKSLLQQQNRQSTNWYLI